MAKPFASLGRRLLSGFLGRRFLGDETAATAVEFALLGAPFFLIIGAILETSLVFMAGQILDSAVGDASRQIRTGQAHQAAFDTPKFEQLICDRLYGLFGDCSGLYSSVSVVTDFGSAIASAPITPSCPSACTWTQADSYSAGGSGSTVLVQVYYKWPIILQAGPFSQAGLSDGTLLFAAVRVFRNEPF